MSTEEPRMPKQQQREALHQFQEPRSLRFAQVVSAVIYCLFASGVIFGYAALKPVLVSEGVYRHLCTPDEIKSHVRVCREQELRMNVMFNIAAVTTNVAALPVGAILDRFGPQVTSLVGCVFLLFGPVLLAIAPMIPVDKFDGFILGYLLLALGGPCIFISTFQLSNAFPTNSGLVLSCVTGAFDASSAVWLAYRLLYQSTVDSEDQVGKGKISLTIFFACYCIVPVTITILQFTIMPKQSYKSMGEIVREIETGTLDPHEEAVDDDEINGLTPPPATARVLSSTSTSVDHEQDGHVRIVEPGPSEHTGLLSLSRKSNTADIRQRRRSSAVSQISAIIGQQAVERVQKKEEHKRAISGVWGSLHGESALRQVGSLWFILVVLFVMLQMLRTNYFIATVRPQYEHLLQSWELSLAIDRFFDLALPLGGLISIPFIGILLDHTSSPLALSVLVLFAAVIGCLGIIPHSLTAGYANVALFVVYRPFFYTSISDYAAKVFGFETFGIVYGLIICTSGLFNLVQSVLDYATIHVHQGNPIPVNIGLLISGLVIGSIFVAFVEDQVNRIKRSKAREALEEAENIQEVVVPDGSPAYR
ncbi:MFS general substrate transporter [Dacryopinax primogenitus]|uniref:MFS general substrate transporter n=1 Tax=Dacryopinax primogenitus (strain DJM 731) TaxID=1858805 RepID=M5GAF9_DACPD|nr:MFS general substrate transporter [Dacryopinax primogenitus]EJU05335.1 MFS general substrate transporter [Dacryopinax primogenitus]